MKKYTLSLIKVLYILLLRQDILLKYYDRWYAKFSQATTQPKLSVQKIGCEKVDAEENALILIQTIV